MTKGKSLLSTSNMRWKVLTANTRRKTKKSKWNSWQLLKNIEQDKREAIRKKKHFLQTSTELGCIGYDGGSHPPPRPPRTEPPPPPQTLTCGVDLRQARVVNAEFLLELQFREALVTLRQDHPVAERQRRLGDAHLPVVGDDEPDVVAVHLDAAALAATPTGRAPPTRQLRHQHLLGHLVGEGGTHHRVYSVRCRTVSWRNVNLSRISNIKYTCGHQHVS